MSKQTNLFPTIASSALQQIRTTFRVHHVYCTHNCSSRRLHVTSQEGTLRRHLKFQSTVASVSTYRVTQGFAQDPNGGVTQPRW